MKATEAVTVSAATGAAVAAPPPEVKRLRADGNISYKLWLACATETNEALHAFAKSWRKEWRSPLLSTLACFPHHGTCFRGVFDGRVELSKNRASDIRMRRTSNGDSEAFGKSAETRSYNEQIIKVLALEFGVPEAQITSATHRWKIYQTGDVADGNRTDGNWTHVHADYFETATYVFSAVLFRTRQ